MNCCVFYIKIKIGVIFTSILMENFYKLERTLESRLEEYKKINSLGCNKIPVICNVKFTDKKFYKFLVDKDSRLCDLIKIFKKTMKIKPKESLYFMCQDRKLINLQKLIHVVYYESKDPEDGLLYISVFKENTFG